MQTYLTLQVIKDTFLFLSFRLLRGGLSGIYRDPNSPVIKIIQRNILNISGIEIKMVDCILYHLVMVGSDVSHYGAQRSLVEQLGTLWALLDLASTNWVFSQELPLIVLDAQVGLKSRAGGLVDFADFALPRQQFSSFFF